MYVNLNAISFIVTVTMKNYFSRCHVAKKTLCCSSMQLFDVVVTISNTLKPGLHWIASDMRVTRVPKVTNSCVVVKLLGTLVSIWFTPKM